MTRSSVFSWAAVWTVVVGWTAASAGQLYAEQRRVHEIHPPAAVRLTHPAPPAEFFPPTEASLASGKVPPVPVAPVGELRGEFDTQAAMLIGGDQMVQEMPEMFAELVSHCRGRVEAMVLVQGEASQQRAEKVLREHLVEASHVHYVNVPHNSMWTRDFGPLTVWQPNGRPALIDAWYGSPDRPDDDAVPGTLAEQLHLPVVNSPLFLDGGNLLSNGRGLLVATYDLVGKKPFADDGCRRRASRVGTHVRCSRSGLP